MSNESRENAEQSADPRVDLAVLRSELAWDRTLLAWVRTVIGLIGAGVGFDKLAQYLHQARLEAGTAIVRNGHLVGLTLTGVSTVMLMIACLQYWQSRRELARIKGSRPPRIPPAMLSAILVIVLGCAVFVVLLGDKP